MNIKKIIFASSNKGKIKEVSEILSEFNIQVIPQSEFNIPDADETGLTFIENAILKARQCCKYTGLPAIADDSGLEIEFLNGEPGIYSARYAGEHSNSKKNIDKVLLKMNGIENRKAKFQCAIALLTHEKDPTPKIFTGSLNGNIIDELKGDNGFGYDPIFTVDSNKTLAETSKEEKNKISHRAKALQKLINYFKSLEN